MRTDKRHFGFRISDFEFALRALPPLGRGGRGGRVNGECGIKSSPSIPTSSAIRNQRSAFTIVELLIVISIIAILATLTLGVVGGFISHARHAATQATVEKIQSLVNQRAQAVDRLMKRSGFMPGTPEMEVAQNNFTGTRLQNVVAQKLITARYFPQSAKEIYNQNLYPNLSAATPEEVFFHALTDTSISDSPIGLDAFSASEIAERGNPNGGPPLRHFVDAWGTPIRFYRWPTRLLRSQGQTGQPNGVAAFTASDLTYAQTLFSSLPTFSGSLANLANDLSRDPQDPLRDALSVSGFESKFVQMPIVPFTNPITYANILMPTPAT